MNGSVLWSSPLPEEVREINCLDLMPGSLAATTCLVTGTHKMLNAFNATSGEEHGPHMSHGLMLETSSSMGRTHFCPYVVADLI